MSDHKHRCICDRRGKVFGFCKDAGHPCLDCKPASPPTGDNDTYPLPSGPLDKGYVTLSPAPPAGEAASHAHKCEIEGEHSPCVCPCGATFEGVDWKEHPGEAASELRPEETRGAAIFVKGFYAACDLRRLADKLEPAPAISDRIREALDALEAAAFNDGQLWQVKVGGMKVKTTIAARSSVEQIIGELERENARLHEALTDLSDARNQR